MYIGLTRHEHTIAQQRERIDELEEELRQHRDKLREALKPTVPIPVEWKLRPQVRRLLAALYEAPDGFIPHERMRLAMGSAADDMGNIVNVQILNLRRAVKHLGITVMNRHGQGYVLPAESRAIIKAALEKS
jgi:DNA-binding response OmpR family regulator